MIFLNAYMYDDYKLEKNNNFFYIKLMKSNKYVFLKNPTSAINCNELAYIEEYYIVHCIWWCGSFIAILIWIIFFQ